MGDPEGEGHIYSLVAHPRPASFPARFRGAPLGAPPLTLTPQLALGWKAFLEMPCWVLTPPVPALRQES